jgi:cytochrome c
MIVIYGSPRRLVSTPCAGSIVAVNQACPAVLGSSPGARQVRPGAMKPARHLPACPSGPPHATTARQSSLSPTRKEPPMKKTIPSALAVIAWLAAAPSAMAQDVAAGKTSFNKCIACHSIGEGAKNKVGPQLNGLDGRKSGTAEGYSYSDANKNSGITWNESQFKEYIKDPKAKIPGTKMIFPGIKNEKEINDLWAFVAQYDKDGKTK